MQGFNKVIVAGNLGRTPELRHTNNGTPVTNFSVAMNWRGSDGEENTEWIDVVAWQRTAETVVEYLSKGSPVLVEGRLQTRSYEAEGVTKYKTEVVASRVNFLPDGNANRSGGGDDIDYGSPANDSDPYEDDDYDDDLPF